MGKAGSARFFEKGKETEDESREKRNLGIDSRDAGGAGCFLHMAAGARKKRTGADCAGRRRADRGSPVD